MNPKRTLTPEEEVLVKELYRRQKEREPIYAYVTAAGNIPMGSTDGKGPWNGAPDRLIPAGQTLKIVMVSTMGDCGLTDDLDATRGYDVRLDWDDALMTDIRLEPAPNKLTIDVRDPVVQYILSRLCYITCPIAHRLQALGYHITEETEKEQSAVLIWMLQKYQAHGAGWKEAIDKELRASTSGH